MKKLIPSSFLALVIVCGLLFTIGTTVHGFGFSYQSDDSTPAQAGPNVRLRVRPDAEILRLTSIADGRKASVANSYGSSFNQDASRFIITIDDLPTLYRLNTAQWGFQKAGTLAERLPFSINSWQWSATEASTLFVLSDSNSANQLYAADTDTGTVSLVKDFSDVLPVGVIASLTKSWVTDNYFAFSWRDADFPSWQYIAVWDRAQDQTFLFDIQDPGSGVSGYREAHLDKSGKSLIVSGDTTLLWRYGIQPQSAVVEIADELPGNSLFDLQLPVSQGTASSNSQTAGVTDHQGLTLPDVRANRSRDGRLILFESPFLNLRTDLYIARLESEMAAPEKVEWTEKVNCDVVNDLLIKTAGQPTVDDASAISLQSISTVDGYFEFTASEVNKERWCGLRATENQLRDSQSLDYALRLASKRVVQIYENGNVKLKAKFKSGDVFRVAVEDSIVKYYQNGSLLYASLNPPVGTLTAGVSLFDFESTVSNAIVAGLGPVGSLTITPAEVELLPGGTQQFVASLGSRSAIITWSANGGTISNTGWYTAPTTPGTYKVTASSGANSALNASAMVKVISPADITPPVLSNIQAGNLTPAGATITWTTDEASDTQVEYGTTAAYGSSTVLNSSMTTSHSATLSGLAANTLYYYRVKSRDSAGNLAISGNFTFTTAAALDTTPPVVTVTSPTANQTVAGSLTLSANASDASGIAGVQFKVDGNNVGSEDTVAPYTAAFSTFALANGNHTVTAVARDSAGNQATSAAVVIRLRQFFVSPSGTASATGSNNSPWNLQTALNHPSSVQPGDTIWLRGGTYKGNFVSKLTGTAAAPIVVRQYPGERAILDGNWSTSLTASISATQRSFSVADGSNLQPATVIHLDNEDIQISSVIGNTVTQANRGWGGTTPASHAAGAIAQTLGNTLTVNGTYAWFWGFELTNSDPNRLLTPPRSNSSSARGAGLNIYAPGSKFINLVIHDNGNGVGFWQQAVDAELYGCVIFNNGWVADGRQTGHGIYTQNEIGTKRIVDTITFGQFSGYGIHAYGSDQAFLKGFHLEGNINPGEIWLIGGGTPVGRLRLLSNYVYAKGIKLGYSNPLNEDAVIENNYIHGSIPVEAKWWSSLTMTGNTVVAKNDPQGATLGIYLRDGYLLSSHQFTGNNYINQRPDLSRPFYVRQANGVGRSYSFAEWQQAGNDVQGSYSVGAARGVKVFVRANQYETGRAHVAIFNWDQLDRVNIDLSGTGLKIGELYEIRDAQNYYGAVLQNGVYDGNPVSVPMKNLVAAVPIGNATFRPPHSPAEFGSYVIVPVP